MKNKGITLIALIVTVIIMIILVSVSLNLILDGGVIDKTREASTQTQYEMDKEKYQLALFAGTNYVTGELDLEKVEENLPEGWEIDKTNNKIISPSLNEFELPDVGSSSPVIDDTDNNDDNANNEDGYYEFTGEIFVDENGREFSKLENIQWAFYDETEEGSEDSLFYIGNERNVTLTNRLMVNDIEIVNDETYRIKKKKREVNLSESELIALYFDLKDLGFENSLVETIDLGNVQNIKIQRLKYLTNLESITNASGVTKIRSRCFADCTNLTEISLTGLSEIDSGLEDSYIQSITLPESLYFSSSNALSICRYLREIIIDGSEENCDFKQYIPSQNANGESITIRYLQ